uniref:RAB6-interacting golgin n=1 Tax=Solanum tuberosum TaxID=4113 RepID=M1CIR3_SOLTU
MTTPKQMEQQQQQQQIVKMKNSGMISYNGSPMIDDRDEEMTRSALSAFRAKEEEIERKRKEVSDKVHAQLGRVEEETKRLAEIREEKEYKETLDAFNAKSKEKAQLVTKLMELVSESEKLRMKKLEELSKHIEALH